MFFYLPKYSIIDNGDKMITREEQRKRKKQKKTKFIILLILFTAILLIATFLIIKWMMDNKKVDKITDDIKNNTEVIEVKDDNAENINPPTNEESDYWKYIKMPLIAVDFNNLLEKNSETVGWIKVEGTSINYPVVQASDNEYYLNHAYDKSKNAAGWIFADYRNNMKDFDKNTIIYGHGRLNTTMFGSLKNITTSNWYKNSNNYVVKFSTPYENTLWQVFAVYKIPTETYYLTTDFTNDKSYTEFLTTLKNRSLYNFNVDLNANDKIITLSTCSNDNKSRIVMHAKLIKKQAR